MSMIKAAVSVTFLASSVFSAGVSAQYVGPTDKVSATTVKQILESSKDDDKVSLKGQLVRQISDETYMFSDGSGEIQVEIDDDVFPKVQVDDKTTVQIRGEVDKGLVGKTEVDVKAFEILK